MNPYTTPLHSEGNGAQFLFYPPAKDNSNIAYNSNNNRFVPSQRFEILRDSIEFYEYLWILNNNTLPSPSSDSFIDHLISNKIIIGTKSYLRDDNFFYNLRKIVGLYLGKEINSIPEIDPICKICIQKDQSNNHTYNLIFTNSLTNLTFNNEIYIPIDWSIYDSIKGYGWLKLKKN